MIEDMYNNIFVVLQGPIDYVDDIVETYLPYKDIIAISTNSIDYKSEIKLINNGFKLIKNKQLDLPGVKNFNNQVLNTFEGVKVAKELNYDYVLKIRADIMIPDLNILLDSLDKKCVYFSSYHNWCGGYLCEHLVGGPVDYMLKLWDIPLSSSNSAPEKQLTMPEAEIKFEFKSEDFDWVLRAASVLSSPQIAIESDGKKVSIVTLDLQNDSAHTDAFDITECTGDKYKMVFKTENITKILPGSYDVSISSKGISHFKNKTVPLQYWITTEQGSKFEKGN
jgi:hypothetical protein